MARKIQDDAGGAERKGLIYEVFVALAVESAFGSMPEVGSDLVGVIADQDVIWPASTDPELVLSVTHWGSHEAAKMKFWRVHEDMFEIKQAFPDCRFASVVFDRNAGSDENLCRLIDAITGEAGISDVNCPAILKLQKELDSPDKQRRFGSGFETILRKSRRLVSDSNGFKDSISALGKAIKDAFDKNLYKFIAERNQKGVGSAAVAFRDPGDRETFFKPALIALLEIGVDLNLLFSKSADLDGLPLEFRQKLLRNGAIAEREDSLTGELEAMPALLQLFERGNAWCQKALKSMEKAVADPQGSFAPYHDHLTDVTDRVACAKRLDLLLNCSEAELEQLISDWGEDMNRCWPIDYSLAIHRSVTPGAKFGVQKLSQRAGIPYEGAPVNCPLPCYAAGDKSRLNSGEIRALAREICTLREAWDFSAKRPETVQRDRRITLMKKLDVLDLLLEQALRNVFDSSRLEIPFPVKHPYVTRASIAIAGRTSFNATVGESGRRAIVFVVAAYEATHKHKEVAGRLRAAAVSGSILPSDRCLLLIDGNLVFEGSRENRIEMLRDAGWDGAYFLDELGELTSDIDQFLSTSSVGIKRIEIPDDDMPLAAEEE